MKESEACPGDKLCALVTALTTAVTFDTALKRLGHPEPVHTVWDDLAETLMNGQREDQLRQLLSGNQVTALHRQAAAAHPTLKRGQVWCLTCGRTHKVSSAHAMANGWPECCGQTMTIDSPAERAS
jgi:hypothetical protein